MKRYAIYKQFKEYVQTKDERPMDEICKSEDGIFKLQAQQLFLREYMKAFPQWRNLLLYHEIGSGKTCTAITMAEEYLRVNPGNKVKVILPARLRTNFLDELISPCGMDKYISAEDFKLFHSTGVTAAKKKKIKTAFMAAIEANYELMSFEKLKISAMKHKDNLIQWAKDFSKDAMIIVDEVHNLLSDKYKPDTMKHVVETGVANYPKGMNTILFRVLTTHAHESCKMVLLTATPIFDNLGQLKEIVKAMNPTVKAIGSEAKLKDVIELLRGKVSYFPGTSINAYPKVEYVQHEVPLSETQDEVTALIQAQEGADEMGETEEESLKEQFMAKQRQVSIACLPGNKVIKGNIHAVLRNMPEYCPKVLKLIEEIKNEPGKHIVYSNFVQVGLKVVEKALENAGWINLMKALEDETVWNSHEGKVYAVWDGSIKDAVKQQIKSIANSKDNIFGKKIRVILGSPSVKEGISFKHVQHIHLLDPVWNQSAKTQIEGRAIRYCSHVDIEEGQHAPLKRMVKVHIYRSVPRAKGLVGMTCDQIIYDVIIENKKKMVRSGERALKQVAIDHYLFRNMYKKHKGITPKSLEGSLKSSLGIQQRDDIIIGKPKKEGKKKNTCPKKRRPNPDCKIGFYKKKNKQDFDCCYKEKKTKMVIDNLEEKVEKKKGNTCPAKRRPNKDGECAEGYKVKVNKDGYECCYKIHKANKNIT